MRKSYKFLRYLPDPETAITAALAIAAFALLALLTVTVFLVFQIVSPPRSGADLSIESLLGNPSAVEYTVPGVGRREGWFFPGLRNAPTIILCHGYRSNRGEILTLASALQENKYNVFLIDFSGHGKSDGRSTLGYKERKEILAALNAVAERDDVDNTRFGIWGVDMGAYAALATAIADKRVVAVALDSVYSYPGEMFQFQLDKSGLSNLPFVRKFSRLGFWLYTLGQHSDVDLSAGIGGLTNTAKLFFQPRDDRSLAEATAALYAKAPEPRQLVVNERSNYAAMLDEERREYDRQLISFFLQHLSPMPRRNP